MNGTSVSTKRSARPTGHVVVETPVGPLLVRGDSTAVTEVLLPNTGAAAMGTSPGALPAALRTAARQLDEYFTGTRRDFAVPLAPAGTPFQQAVWTALDDIPYGETITYKELAAAVGRPGAFRAVGQANGANPLPIFHPCHRVVAAGGHLGGYGGGLDVKRQLLALEGSPLAVAP